MIVRSTNVRAALRSRQRGFLLNPYRFGAFAGDPSFANVVTLINFDGTNGSTTITDRCQFPKSFTAGGNAQLSTAQAKWGPSSLALDGTGDYVFTADSAAFTLGTAAFTLECWVRFASLTGAQYVCGQVNSGFGNTTLSIAMLKESGNQMRAFVGSGSSLVGECISTGTVSLNTWHLVSYTRSGSNFRLFIDGTLDGTATSAGSVNDSTEQFSIGRPGAFNGAYMNGFVDDFRYTTNVARYTASFTPPAAAFPNF